MSAVSTSVSIALVTCPQKDADRIARALVERRVAACVNVVPAIRSVYRWKGEVQEDDEALLIVKTADSRFDDLRQAVLSMHPYELPEIVAVSVEHGHVPYLDWVAEATRDNG